MTLTRFVDSKGHLVNIGDQLGVGGQGAVYLLQGRPGEVAKVYLKPPLAGDIQKLEAQVQACRPDILSISAWPSALLKDSSGGVKGLIMPLVNPSEYTEIHNLFGPASRRKYFPKADWTFLIHVARNVARAFAVIHAGGHVVGDVSSRNILVSQQGMLQLIDTDSFQVQFGHRVFPCPVGTAESTPPELQGQTFGTFIRTANHDLFGMAVIIFQLLFHGRHPYSGIHADQTTPNPAEAIKANKFAYSLHARGVRPPPQTLRLSDLSVETSALFERAFAPSVNNRPTAKEWDDSLAALLRAVVTCKQDPTHKYIGGKQCPWCAHNQAITAKAGFGVGAKRLNANQELNKIWQIVQAVPKPLPPQVPPTPTNVFPLAIQLPARPTLAFMAIPETQLQGAKTRRTVAVVALIMLGLMVWLGGNLMLELVIGGIALLLLVSGSERHVRDRHLKTQQEAHQEAIQRYEQERRQAVKQLQTQCQQLEAQLTQLYSKQKSDTALMQYQKSMGALETRRSGLLVLIAEETKVLQQIREKHRNMALSSYLKRQVLKAGMINGIGPSVLLSLHQAGVRTAYDVTTQVNGISGIGPKRAADLMLWRQQQESFFNFDPATVPVSDLTAAITAHDQKVLTQLQLLAAEVGRFSANVKTWTVLDESVRHEISAKSVEVAQYKITIQQLEAS